MKSDRMRVLVTHPWMGRGGSEATAMWTLQALQDDFDLTFVTASELDWEELNGAYGSSVDPEKIKVLRAPHLPTVNSATRLVQLQQRYFERYCHGLADDFDLCISAYNPVDFGKPGIQLIGDFSFSEEMRKRLYIHGDDSFQHRETFIRKCYLKTAEIVAIPYRPLSGRGDLVLANSLWAVDQLEEFFDLNEAPIIYPPVILPEALPGTVRDPLGIACLGRVSPEKELDRIIEILAEVRKRGPQVTLQFIGHLGDDAYSRKISGMIDHHRDWITAVGFLDLPEKQALLSRQSFAIHACRIEAFGIAVAEMASLGCVPFIPDTGGAGEIVPFEELQFGESDEAVEKILHLLANPEHVQDLRFQLAAEVAKFGPQMFMGELKKHVADFLAPSIAVEKSDTHDARTSKSPAPTC